jgi:tetratricopeptide (TPR) repeat protein
MLKATKMKFRIRWIGSGLAGGACALATVWGGASSASTNSPDVPGRAAVEAGRVPEPARATGGRAEPAAPATPREFYNAGTQQLGAGKLREAEAFLESTLASQQERLQAPALYNLGHVRFAQGVEVLKQSPPAKPTIARGRAAAQQAHEAIRQADEALRGNDLQKLVAAYLHGRGARKELKAATEAVRRALTVHGAALARWQRASGDFKSVMELQRTDADSQHNAEVVDRCIAKLVDSLREMQECANGMCDQRGELGEKLKQLKGRIPGQDMPPGAAGDDDEDEDSPLGPQPGQEEGPSREGKEITLSQEQAGWVLDGFKLDSERRLPMGQGEVAQPKDRNRRTW